MGRAVEAYAHCWTAAEIRNLTENDRERFGSHGHIFLIRALKSNKNSTAVVSALLDLPNIPLNLSEPDQDGNTALLVAAQERNLEVVKILLSRFDCDPNVGNRITGNTPLHEAAKSADCLNILVTLLEDRRLNVDLVNKEGQSALHVACLSPDGKKAVTEVVREIIDTARETVRSLPKFLGRVDRFGRTALHYLSQSGNDEAVKVILKAAEGGQELALQRDNKGQLAIHVAIQMRQPSVVELLLEFGDCEDADGYRMIHHAVQSNCEVEIINKCLNKHPTLNPTLRNNYSLAKVVDLFLVLLAMTTHYNIAQSLLINLDTNHVRFEEHWPEEHKHRSRNPPGHPGRLLLWAIHCGVDHRGRGAQLIDQILKWLPDHAGVHLDPITRRNGLHISAILQNAEAVKAFCSERGQCHDIGVACDKFNKTPLDYAFGKDTSIQRMIRLRKDVNLDFEKMEKSSQNFVNAANNILVGSVLVLTLTYTHCLSALETAKLREEVRQLGLPDLSDKTLKIVDIIVLARLAFFLAIATTIMAAFAALPFSVTNFYQQAVDDRHVKRLLNRKSRLVMGASYLLVLSLGAVFFNFICSQLIAPYIDYDCEMACHYALIVYGILSVVWVGRNVVQLWKESKTNRVSDPPDARYLNSCIDDD